MFSTSIFTVEVNTNIDSPTYQEDNTIKRKKFSAADISI